MDGRYPPPEAQHIGLSQRNNWHATEVVSVSSDVSRQRGVLSASSGFTNQLRAARCHCCSQGRAYRLRLDERVLQRSESGACNGATVTLAQPQRRHEYQAKTRPQDVQDNIVDVCSSVAPPCHRKELKELDAA